MLRTTEKANKQVILKLLENINEGIESMLKDYTIIYTEEELNLLDNVHEMLKNKIIEQNSTNNINELLKFEELLKPYAFRTWEYSYKNGYQYISWFKNDKIGDIQQVISATFSNDVKNTFCDSRYGISYEVEMEGFLGACNKDAATLLEENTKLSIYTIGKTSDGKVINSYNLATPIITPVQTLDNSLNNYKSKHNEIILDSRYVKPKSVVYTNENDINMVNIISEKYNIPIEYKKSMTI